MYSNILEKKRHDGGGKQQKQDAGACGNGTVAQIPFTALNRGFAATADKAALGLDTFMLEWEMGTQCRNISGGCLKGLLSR